MAINKNKHIVINEIIWIRKLLLFFNKDSLLYLISHLHMIILIEKRQCFMDGEFSIFKY